MESTDSLLETDHRQGDVIIRDVLDLLDRLLRPGYLLTASQAICIHPGETPQPLHSDDPFYTLARPRPAISVSTIWALDDFTAIGGGTEELAGSHLWGDDELAHFQNAGAAGLAAIARTTLAPSLATESF
jgi:ectoine hydroxylase-related dioxygenase (phytanoyl-CoA dioxygenase family)